MAAGRLRVLLGAAPGVGKTFTMLEEGRRLAAEGRDVVIAVVETHGRSATAALVQGLEVVPRRVVDHRGVRLEEMDLRGVLDRRPDVALVDELAHSNAPGSANPKRWQDVRMLLDAGIDVISTVNIQHIESLRDVVERITGVAQRETVPDDVLRAADQVELVDLTPQSLRDRLAQGLVYPAERVDAALSNYFRLGNLTALREVALLWLADEVDSALRAYRREQGIEAAWEARERIVVALTGGPEGETLLRRGARIAARSSGGELHAVRVVSPDGLADRDASTIAAQRELVERLGGSYSQVVAEEVAPALVDFARSVDATQLVIGASRRSRLATFFGGAGTSATVIRLAGEIDVHIVAHAEQGTRRSLPKPRGAVSLRRRVAGFAITVLGLPALTWLLSAFRSEESITSDVLIFQLFVVVVAMVGGLWPAVLAALGAGVLLDYFFVEPLYTVTISDPLHLLALVIFVVVGVLVSLVVDQAARRARIAARAGAEAELLISIAGAMLRSGDVLGTLVTRLREAFGLTSVLLRQDGEVVAAAADPGIASDDDEELDVALGRHGSLYLRGRALTSSDRRVLAAFVSQLEASLLQRSLAGEVEAAKPIAEADRLRSALLAAVGHDLRRPLAAATAAVSALEADDVALSRADRTELLATADESLRALSALVTDLLDVSRLQAGVLGVQLEPVALDDIVGGALDELGLGPGEVRLHLDPVPTVSGDPVLLQRAVVNLISNARRFSPADAPPRVASSSFGDRVQLRVVDSGPGIPQQRRTDVFVPFQRLGDTDNTVGVGLGLALSRGFLEAMGGTLEAEDTPGGGLTMVLELAAATERDHSNDGEAR